MSNLQIRPPSSRNSGLSGQAIGFTTGGAPAAPGIGSSNLSLPREEIIDVNSCVFRLNGQMPTFKTRQETYVPRAEAVNLLRKMEEESKSRIAQYRDYALQLRDRYRVFEHEASTHYEKIAEEMRTRVKRQIKEQEEIHNKLKWDIEQNNIMITFLQSRLEEAQKRIIEKEEEFNATVLAHQQELIDLKLKNEQDAFQKLEDAKARQRDASVDCPMDKEVIAELEAKLEQARIEREHMEAEKVEQERLALERIERVIMQSKIIEDEFIYHKEESVVIEPPEMHDMSIENLHDLLPESPRSVKQEEIKPLDRAETPVDLTTFLNIKQQKKQNKELITIWYAEFERKYQSKPNDQVAVSEIQGLLNDRRALVKEYTAMKTKLINQSKMPEESIKQFSPRTVEPTIVYQQVFVPQENNTVIPQQQHQQVIQEQPQQPIQQIIPQVIQQIEQPQQIAPLIQQQQIQQQQPVQQLQNQQPQIIQLPPQIVYQNRVLGPLQQQKLFQFEFLPQVRAQSQQQIVQNQVQLPPQQQIISNQQQPEQQVIQNNVQILPQVVQQQPQQQIIENHVQSIQQPQQQIIQAPQNQQTQEQAALVQQQQQIIQQQQEQIIKQQQLIEQQKNQPVIQQQPIQSPSPLLQQQQPFVQAPPQVIQAQQQILPEMISQSTQMTPRKDPPLPDPIIIYKEIQVPALLPQQHQIEEKPKPSVREIAISPLDMSIVTPPEQQPIIIVQTSEEDKHLIQRLQRDLNTKIFDNRNLEKELQRLTKIMAHSMSEKEVVKNLKRELDRTRALVEQRDKRINELIKEEKLGHDNKDQIIKDLEMMKVEREKYVHEIENKQHKILEQTVLIGKQQQEITEMQRAAGKVQIVEKIVYQTVPNTENAQPQVTQPVVQQQMQQQPTYVPPSQQQMPVTPGAPPQAVIQYIQAPPEKIYVTDDNTITILQDQLKVMKEQNLDLQNQIEFLKRFQEEQRVLNANSLQQLDAQNKGQALEITNINGQLHRAKEELNNLRGGHQNEQQNLQQQMDLFREKLDKKKAKINNFKQSQSEMLAAKEAAAVQKKHEIEQLQMRFKEQISILEDEIALHKSDLEKLKQSKQGALEEVSINFKKQIEELEKKYRAEIHTKEVELGKCQQRIWDLESEEKKLNRELEQLRGKFADRNKEAEELAGRIKQLEVAVSDALKVKEEVESLRAENAKVKIDNDVLQQKFKEEQKKRKELHNNLEDMKGAIRLFCRIRPLSKTELEREESRTPIAIATDEFTVNLNGKSHHTVYTFDSVFGVDSTQEQVFDETKRLIQSSIDGFNVCIFAYGQTGSGKTHTIQGNPASPGITPRAIEELFALTQSMNNYDVKLSCYMVELYKVDLRDLLIPKGQPQPKLEIKESAALGGMVYIPGVTEQQIKSVPEAIKIFQFGLEHRMTRATKMNDSSSRSHLIFAIVVDSTNRQTRIRTVGKLSFVDLAGSEKASKTGTDKEGAAEGRAINQSLSALGNVISALSKGLEHIPYRDHPLTMLMKDSLGGTAKTLMFVNVSPSNYNEAESKNSMDYATRVKKIKNKIQKNVESNTATGLKKTLQDQESLITRLKEIIMRSNLAEEIKGLEALLHAVGSYSSIGDLAAAGKQYDEGVEEEEEEEKGQ